MHTSRKLPSLVAGLFALLLSSPAMAATVDVTFVEPEHFADAGGRGGFRDVPTTAAVMREIRDHLVGLGTRALAPGQVLKIEILDIDLAGRRDVLGAHGEDVRVYERTAPPRIKLRYALEQDGRVIASGDDRLIDPTYLDSLSRASNGDPIRYERPMLTRWFEKRFVEGTPPS